MSSFFRRSQDAGSDVDAGYAAAASWDAVTAALDHLSRLSAAQCAAEILESVAAAIDEKPSSSLQMSHLLEPLLPIPVERSSDLSPQQIASAKELELLVTEAFQALVLTRMLTRREAMTTYGTIVWYANSKDGRAALRRGDTAEVIARRLPA